MSNLDFISRSELLAEIDQERKRHIDSGNYGAEHLMVHSLRRLVEDAPAIDAAPVVHGRWKSANMFGVTAWECNKCNAGFGRKWEYCPHCGARMDKEE